MNMLGQSFKALPQGLQNFDLNVYVYQAMKLFREYFTFFEKKGRS